MSEEKRSVVAYLASVPEARREALRGLTDRISEALCQADALGCEKVAIYLAAAREVAEALIKHDMAKSRSS